MCMCSVHEYNVKICKNTFSEKLMEKIAVRDEKM